MIIIAIDSKHTLYVKVPSRPHTRLALHRYISEYPDVSDAARQSIYRLLDEAQPIQNKIFENTDIAVIQLQ